MYFQYNSCIPMDSHGKIFDSVTGDMLEQLGKMPVDKIVIDIRNNSGGLYTGTNKLVDGLSKYIRENKHCSVFTILGRETFSSGILFARDMRDQAGAVFYGESTRGKPSHYGNMKTMKLPNSRLIISYSTKYFEDTKDGGDTFMPQGKVEITLADYIKGIDPILERIIKQ